MRLRKLNKMEEIKVMSIQDLVDLNDKLKSQDPIIKNKGIEIAINEISRLSNIARDYNTAIDQLIRHLPSS